MGGFNGTPSEDDIAAIINANPENPSLWDRIKKFFGTKVGDAPAPVVGVLPPGYSYHPLTGTYGWGPPGLSDVANYFEGYALGTLADVPGPINWSSQMALVMHP